MTIKIDQDKKVLFYILASFATLSVIGALMIMIGSVMNEEMTMVVLLLLWVVNITLTGVFLALLKLAYEGKNFARIIVICIGMLMGGSFSLLRIFMTYQTFLTLAYSLVTFVVFFIGTLLLIISNPIRKFYETSKTSEK